ncbi:MAG: hypothetical protein KIT48_20340 [Pseudolabrys sp.]|nr:hypothetical protein [Pseudolabrys sp.]
MALLDNLLGGNGGSDSSHDSNDFNSVIGTNPQLGLNASDILHSQSSDGGSDGGDSSSFTGIGDLGLGIAAPTVVGISNSSEHMSEGNQDSGGLLGGLL